MAATMSKSILLSLVVLCALSLPTVYTQAQGTLEDVVNTNNDELYPVVSMKGDVLYFARFGYSRNRGEQNASDVWATFQSANGEWSKPVNVGGPINTQATEWPLSLSTSGKQLLIYAAGKGQLLNFRQSGRFWQRSGVQYIEGGHANVPEAFFQIAQDDYHLVCVLPQLENPAHKDLYLSTRTGSTEWSSPQSLPTIVNSTADEQSAYLAPDNRTLYFASNRPGGFGGYDLYLTKRLGEGWFTWTEPVNLGSTINTDGDELFISVPAHGSNAFITRRMAEGDMDILQMNLPQNLRPEPLRLINGTVQLEESVKIDDAEVLLEDTDGGMVVRATKVGPDGAFSMLLPAEEKGVVYAEYPGYFPVAQPVQPDDQMLSTALASSYDEAVFTQEESDIRTLHLQLERLDSELVVLRQMRHEALAAVREKDYELDLPAPSDPEIDALRHRYRYYTEIVGYQDTIPDDGYDEAGAKERELKDMQARFKRYYVREKAIQKAQDDFNNGEEHLWEEQPTFEALQAQAQAELEQELIPEVEQRLIQDVELSVKVEPNPGLTESERLALTQKAIKLQAQIRDGLSSNASLSSDWTAKGGGAQQQDVAEAWEAEVLQDLKVAMHDEVQEALVPKLAEKVRGLVEIDGQYQVKRLERSMIQQKLDQKIEQQLAAEPGRQLRNDPDAVAPLVPAIPEEEKHYQEVEQNLILVPAEVGRNIPLNSVVFEEASDRLKPGAYAELNRLLAFLNQHANLVVEVGAHVDQSFSYARALEVTEQRAQVVTGFLIGNGIASKRLESKGYGKAFPAVSPSSSERIEIRIIGKH